jgi:hypothetical protein
VTSLSILQNIQLLPEMIQIKQIEFVSRPMVDLNLWSNRGNTQWEQRILPHLPDPLSQTEQASDVSRVALWDVNNI